jgi:hypothetical protein
MPKGSDFLSEDGFLWNIDASAGQTFTVYDGEWLLSLFKPQMVFSN